MNRRLGVALVLVIGLLAGMIWIGSTRSPRWNVLLITLDTTRADHLGCYGLATAATPNLDRLAATGVLFERAYTVAPITLPAHATLHTGLLPPEHGLRINGVSRLPDGIPTLAELLREQGYRTGAFVSSLVLDARFGLSRGFHVYDDRFNDGPRGPAAERPADESISLASTWLRANSKEPFFCWIHLYDPHEPYQQHAAEFGDQFQQRPYDAEIAFVDRQLGHLFEVLDRTDTEDRTIIIVVGDHGEGLGDHHEATHGYLTYNSTLHVPLLMRHPQQQATGQRVAEQVSLADLFPTILDALHLPIPSGLTGRSLGLGRTTISLEPRPCYAETEAPLMEGGWSPLKTWTTAEWKYIHSTRSELYDLQSDPAELKNILDQHPDEAAHFRQALTDFESRLTRREGPPAVMTSQEQRALAGLGYAAGRAPAKNSELPRRDIKDTLLYAEQVHTCMHLIDEQKLTEARGILEKVVAALPDYPKAWGTLGVCRAIQGDHQPALEHFKKALELDANQNFARIAFGRSLLALNRLVEAAQQLETATQYDPAAADAHYFYGQVCRKLKRWDDADHALQKAADLNPAYARP